MASLRGQDNSDVYKTQVIANFHHYTIQLCLRSKCSNLGVILPKKTQSRHLKLFMH